MTRYKIKMERDGEIGSDNVFVVYKRFLLLFWVRLFKQTYTQYSDAEKATKAHFWDSVINPKF